jgi:pyruvate carboxylase
LIGWRNIIKEKGPEGFAKAVREYPGVLIMDTTWVSHVDRAEASREERLVGVAL